ncbi:hypothetical protein AXF42_Ash007225 [Apostasia shenzhenica]|uniref:DUF1677 domain-containing protein n=1 Tax=Apostasia shenzhenica TaxID=1088818 RepID=A0A2I0B9K6_9ASPA|nr:hypothetical protein AXF42_Ash007225 [Apostasia shenzhenica]
MAPNGDVLLSTQGAVCDGGGAPPFSRSSFSAGGGRKAETQSMTGLQRAMSDLSFELSKEDAAAGCGKLPAVSEVQEARCECCGMSEEFTPAYIRRVREKFAGRWICGLCSEAVKEEMEKKGSRKEDAINAHMSACSRFSRFGRTHPVLYQAEAMREILRKCSSCSWDERRRRLPPAAGKKGGIARTSSCFPAITR